MTVTAELVQGRIQLAFPWDDADLHYAAKAVGYGRRLGARKVWRYPLRMDVCHSLRTAFGRALEIGPELWAWAEKENLRLQEVQSLHDLDLSKPVDLPRVRRLVPRMWRAMQQRGFQTVGAKYLMLVRQAILADQPGLGKTLQVLAALVEDDARDILVLAPSKAASKTWPDEIGKWLGHQAQVFLCSGSRQQREAVIGRYRAARDRGGIGMRFLIVNTEMASQVRIRTCPRGACDGKDRSCEHVRRHKWSVEPGRAGYAQLFEDEWDAILGDETHNYLIRANPKGKAGSQSQVGRGLHKLRLHENGLKFALTGTPMRGKPRLIWPTLAWLRPDIYTSQHRWNKDRFEFVFDPFVYGKEKVTDRVRPDKEQELGKELSAIMIRRTKAELRAINPDWAPPPKEYFEVWVGLDPQQRRQYEAIERGIAAVLQGGMALTTEGVLAQGTRLKQLASFSLQGKPQDGSVLPTLPSAKFEAALDKLAELGITGSRDTEQGDNKVIIASQFARFVDLMQDELGRRGIAAHKITGDTSHADVDRQMTEFQSSGGPRVFLLSTKAGGVSLTLDAADDVFLMDETWVPDEQEQVEDRAHRTSRTDHQVNVWLFRAEGTIDEAVGAANTWLDTQQKRVLDGRRGVAYLRHLKETKKA